MECLNDVLTNGLQGEHLVASLRCTVHPHQVLSPGVTTVCNLFRWTRNLLEFVGVNTNLSLHAPQNPISYGVILSIWPERAQNINQLYQCNCRIANALIRNPPTISDDQLHRATGTRPPMRPRREIWIPSSTMESALAISAHTSGHGKRRQGANSVYLSHPRFRVNKELCLHLVAVIVENKVLIIKRKITNSPIRVVSTTEDKPSN